MTMIKKTEMSKSKHESINLVLILCLAFLFYIYFIYRTVFSVNGETYFTLVDDAMISLRYAKNLSNGFGLVWNIGEPPIEGFTNMGWTLYAALLHKIPISESKISLLVMITSSFFLIGNAFLSFKLVKIVVPQSRIAPLASAFITAFYFPLVFWSLRGMEVGITTFLVYLSVLLAINSSRTFSSKRSLILGVIMLLAILVRLDTAFQITLILWYLLYDFHKKKTSIFRILPPLSLFLMGMIGILIFQYLYFGSVLPNTYYLKLTGVPLIERITVGVKVFVDYASRDFIAPLCLILAGLLFFRPLRGKNNYLLIALFLIQCAYSISVGGDYSEQMDLAANRFIAQGMPSVIILSSIIIEHFFNFFEEKVGIEQMGILWNRAMQIGIISLVILFIMSGPTWFKWTYQNSPLLDGDIRRAKLGILIRENTDEDAVIAVHAAGQISYFSNRRIIDLLGKSDPLVAKGPPVTSFRPGHNKWNYEYSITSLRPDIVCGGWDPLNKFLTKNSDYSQLVNNVYLWIRNDSTRINVAGLEKMIR